MTACEECGSDRDINGFCVRGCDDSRDLGPWTPPPTSRNRFGGRQQR